MSDAQLTDAIRAENSAHQRQRLSGQIRAALKSVGLDLYPAVWDEVLTEVVIQETAAVRVRLADMLEAAIPGARCSDDQDRLTRIIHVAINHRVNAEGEVYLEDQE